MTKNQKIKVGISTLLTIGCLIWVLWLTNSSASKDIEHAKQNSEIVLVDFYGDGCKPCRMISPYIDEIENEYENIKVLKVDINGSDDLHSRYDIHFIPTVIIFYQGDEFVRLVGYNEKEEYTRYLDNLMEQNSSTMIKFEK